MGVLRQKLMALTDEQLAMLVAVSFEGINDLAARNQIAEMRGLSDAELETFGEQVVDRLLEDANDVLGFNAPNIGAAG